MLTQKVDEKSTVFTAGTQTVLTVGTEIQGKDVQMTLSGELRRETTHYLEDELISMATVGANVVVDMSGVTYVCTSALQVFLNVQRKNDALSRGELVLKGITDRVYSEFDQAGLADLLNIED